MSRLDSLRHRAAGLGGDALLLTHSPHVRWATGFSGSNAMLVVTPQRAVLFTDGRYTTQAATETEGRVEVMIASDLTAALAEPVSADTGRNVLADVGRLLVEGDVLSVSRYEKLASSLDAELVAVDAMVHELVAAKDEDQIESIRRAQAVTAEVFEHLIPMIGPGVSELDLSAEIIYQHMKRGASAMAFEPIVASGPRGALPHARPSARTFRPGDLVVIDMGGVVDGYCADMTRTVAVGEPSPEMRRAYDAVGRALEAAFEETKAGASGAGLDRAARSVLEAAGLAEYFTHSLGHGVGLEVHEWPRLSSQVDHRIPAGACVTLEPGVYLPERFGIRTEDLVVVREGGAESLTLVPRELVVV